MTVFTVNLLEDKKRRLEVIWVWNVEVEDNLDIYCVSWFTELSTLSSTEAEVLDLF